MPSGTPFFQIPKGLTPNFRAGFRARRLSATWAMKMSTLSRRHPERLANPRLSSAKVAASSVLIWFGG